MSGTPRRRGRARRLSRAPLPRTSARRPAGGADLGRPSPSRGRERNPPDGANGNPALAEKKPLVMTDRMAVIGPASAPRARPTEPVGQGADPAEEAPLGDGLGITWVGVAGAGRGQPVDNILRSEKLFLLATTPSLAHNCWWKFAVRLPAGIQDAEVARGAAGTASTKGSPKVGSHRRSRAGFHPSRWGFGAGEKMRDSCSPPGGHGRSGGSCTPVGFPGNGRHPDSRQCRRHSRGTAPRRGS